MSSIAKIFEFLLKVLKFNKMFLDIENTGGDKNAFTEIIFSSRNRDNCIKPPEKIFKQYHTESIATANNKSHVLKSNKGEGKIIVFFHGGAYVKGPLPLQWKFLSKIAGLTDVDIAVLDYPKIPEYTCSDAIDYCVDFCDKNLNEYNWEDIIFMGDSAGGGLALSVVMALRDLEKSIPDKCILFSPWLDVSMSDSEVDEYRDKDLILTVEGLRICGQFYAGDLDTKDWKVSPLYGNLEGLPETHVFAGGSELFYPDCRNFVDKAKDAGVDAELHFKDKMQHDWVVMPMIPEAEEAIKLIANIIIK